MSRRRTNRPGALALYGILSLTLAGCAGGPPAPNAPEDPVVIPLEPYVAGLRTMDVRIGEGTYPMIFDTAGGVNLVTPALAEEIGCEPFGRLTGFRHTGEAISTERCGPVTLGAGPWTGTAPELGVFDLMSLLRGAPEVGGIVGLPLFEDQAITIHLAQDRVVIESRDSLENRIEDMQPLVIRDARQAGGASLDIFVAVETERGFIWLELDSGNAGPVMLSPHAVEQLGLDLPEEGIGDVTLPIAGLGPVTVEARNHDSIYDGLLNRVFIEDLVITLDLATMRAWARHSEPE